MMAEDAVFYKTEDCRVNREVPDGQERSRGVAQEALGFRPLYRQVRDVLVKRIADGVWQAGEMLPSEPDIAADLGVSPGTVRKALDEMTAENLVVPARAAAPTSPATTMRASCSSSSRSCPAFSGEREFPRQPVPRRASRRGRRGGRDARPRPGGAVLRLDRVRLLGGRVCVLERTACPARSSPGSKGAKFRATSTNSIRRRSGSPSAGRPKS